MTAVTVHHVSLVAAGPQDEAFLFRVYAGTRQEEMALLGDWDEARKQAFLAMQFDAQHRHYRAHFPQAAYQVVMLDGEPVGRLYLDRRENEVRVLDIALLPEQRGKGIGSLLLRQVIEEAEAADMPVRIHVEKFNRALSLYRRLGFVPVQDLGVYFLMERRVGGENAH